MYVRPPDVQAAVDLGAYELRAAPMGQPVGTPQQLILNPGDGLVITFWSDVIGAIASPALVTSGGDLPFHDNAGGIAADESTYRFVYCTRDLAEIHAGQAVWFYPYGTDRGDGRFQFASAETLLLTPQIMEIFEQLPSDDPEDPPDPGGGGGLDPNCPVRPPWPYEELSIDVSQGPSGAMRYRNVRQR